MKMTFLPFRLSRLYSGLKVRVHRHRGGAREEGCHAGRVREVHQDPRRRRDDPHQVEEGHDAVWHG